MRRHAILLAVAVAACSRPEPSPEFAQAQRRRAELVAAHPQDASVRPEMDEVLQLLARVPAGSADAAAAAELRARIEAERKAAADEEARRNEALARATTPPPMPAVAGTRGAGAPAEPREERAATGLRPAPGAKLEEVRALAGDCLEKKSDVEIVEGQAARAGEAWGLKAGEECASRYPEQVGNWLLFANGAFVSASPAINARTTTVTRTEERREEFEAVPLPGGGFGRRTADGRIEPLPEGATVRRRDQQPPPGAPRR